MRALGAAIAAVILVSGLFLASPVSADPVSDAPTVAATAAVPVPSSVDVDCRANADRSVTCTMMVGCRRWWSNTNGTAGSVLDLDCLRATLYFRSF